MAALAGCNASLLSFCLILVQLLAASGRPTDISSSTAQVPVVPRTAGSSIIFGFSVEYESSVKSVDYIDGVVHALEGLPITLQLFGLFTASTSLIYSDTIQCTHATRKYSHSYPLTLHGVRSDEGGAHGLYHHRATVSFVLPPHSQYTKIYFCLQTQTTKPTSSESESESEWISQNSDLVIHIKRRRGAVTPASIQAAVSGDISIIPLWVQLIFISVLLMLCGLMSGPNLGLLSITKTDLQIILKTGSPKERKFAARVRPVRLQGNQLLCCILLSNVMINATLATLVDHIISGFISIIISTLVIVIVGEIVPQAICMKHGLAVSAKTIYITKFFMVLTFPLAWPLGKVLDFLVGTEDGPIYTRERLHELLKITETQSGLDPLELGIIYGALDMKKKTAHHKMRLLDEIFMLSIDAKLDEYRINEIVAHCVEFVPVYEKRRTNIVGVLHTSQLILANQSSAEKFCLSDLMDTNLFRVPECTTLDYLFEEFTSGRRIHIAFVHTFQVSGFSQCLGVITLTDVVQQLLCTEIKCRPPGITQWGFPTSTSIEVSNFCTLASLQFIANNVLPHIRKLSQSQAICPYDPSVKRRSKNWTIKLDPRKISAELNYRNDEGDDHDDEVNNNKIEYLSKERQQEKQDSHIQSRFEPEIRTN